MRKITTPCSAIASALAKAVVQSSHGNKSKIVAFTSKLLLGAIMRAQETQLLAQSNPTVNWEGNAHARRHVHRGRCWVQMNCSCTSGSIESKLLQLPYGLLIELEINASCTSVRRPPSGPCVEPSTC